MKYCAIIEGPGAERAWTVETNDLAELFGQLYMAAHDIEKEIEHPFNRFEIYRLTDLKL